MLCAHTISNFALEKITGITFLRVTIMIILNFVVLQLAMVLKNKTMTIIKG